jgi:retron-type reverse transcriptase
VAHAIKDGAQQLMSGAYRFVVKSDIADFYASMHHDTLLALCERRVKDPRVLELLSQYMNRVEIHREKHQEGHALINIGVLKGYPLSPLMEAITFESLLKSLDKMPPRECLRPVYG